MNIPQAYALLQWARTPGPHGGNPYGQPHVKEAEQIVARHEGRKPDIWAGKLTNQQPENYDKP